MAFKARIYLQRFGHIDAEYIGEVDLELRPIRNGRARFAHQGAMIVGHIESVTPPDWDSTGAIPAVYVMQR